MTDPEFLTWVRDRLVNTYGESENVDFVHRLNDVIRRMTDTRHFLNDLHSQGYHVDDLLDRSTVEARYDRR